MGFRLLALPLLLIFSFAPTAFSSSNLTELHEVGSRVVLSCGIADANETDVEWMKDGQMLESPNVIDGNLLFDSVQKSDSGTYKCSLKETNVTDQTTTIKLVVIDKPGPPGQPSVSNIKWDEVTISWLPSDSGDKVNKYNIQQKRDDNATEWMSSDPPCVTSNNNNNNPSSCQPCPDTNCSSVTVMSLQPNTTYIFRIQAEIGGLVSEFSQPSEPATTESRGNETTPAFTTVFQTTNNLSTTPSPTTPNFLPGPPQDLRARDITASRMTLRWKPPNMTGTDLYPVKHYKLYVLPYTALNTQLPAAPTKYNLTGLEPSTVYNLKLTAVNDFGEGPAASLDQITDSKAPGVPRSVKVVYMTQRRALVMWAEPTRAYNKVDAYTVSLRKYGETDYSWKSSVMAPASYYQLTDLEYGATYLITVSAMTFSTIVKTVPYVGPETPPLTYAHVPADLPQKTSPRSTTPLSLTVTRSAPSSTQAGVIPVSDDSTLVKIAAVIGAFLAILLVLLVALVFFKWRKRIRTSHYYTRADSPPMQPPLELGVPDLQALLDHKSIVKEDFEKHVMAMHADSDHGFSVEYEDIRKVSTKHLSYLHSKLPENKNKNRYLDIVAYDQSRVQLIPISAKQKHTDYINANYVDGYYKPKAFIASQGPLKSTVNDFWRMIWEQGGVIIIMLTNLVEKGKKKCEQYWPSEGTEVYGYIEVTLEDTNNLAAYTIRRFTVKNLKSKKVRGQHVDRMVYQYHYTAWPDHGIPEDSLPVISFVKKSSAANPPEAGPIIVHCSAGVGRTGTYIVIDTMLKQLKDTQRINVVAFMKHIRQQRNYLVQTEIQYTFLHDALLEAIRSGNTDINLDDYNGYLEKLEEKILLPNEAEISLLEKQLQRINKYMPKEYELQSALRPYNKSKNRSLDKLPVERSRVKLVPKPAEDGSDYINASFLQGYRSSQEYIVTQHPMQQTVVDFWRMIWDQNSETIVSLTSMESMEDGDLVLYWPTGENKNYDCGNFTVTLTNEEHHLNMITRDFLLQSSQDDYMMNVRQFQYGYWPESCTPDTVFELVTAVQKWKQQFEGPVTVHDKLGGSTAVAFCALSTLNRQIRHEEYMNIYEIAMLYNLRRPGVFPTKEDYLFLFTSMKTAIETRHKERKLGSGRHHLPSNHIASHKKHHSNAVDSIRRAFSLHEDRRPHLANSNVARSHSFSSEHGGSPKSGSAKAKKRNSELHSPKIAEEEAETLNEEDELTTLHNADGDVAVKWTKPADGVLTPKNDSEDRKLSNNNSSMSDYRESGFEEDEVFAEV